jgi:hypothetical protein
LTRFLTVGPLSPQDQKEKDINDQANAWIAQKWNSLFSSNPTPGAGTHPSDEASSDSVLNVIAQHETGNRNVPNYRYDATHTASGFYQITDTNWRAYGQGVVDLSKYPHAIDAPKEVQAQVAARMYREQGIGPWSSSSGGSIKSVAQFNAEVAADHTRMLQAAKAGAAGNVNSANTSNTITIGDVNVHGVDPNNGPATGAAIHDSLRDKMDVLFSNTGLQ